MEIDLDSELVRLAFHFKANGTEDRPTVKTYEGLQSIRVEPHEDGAIILACDGAWMFLGIDPTGFCDEPVCVDLSVHMHCRLKDSKTKELRVRARHKHPLRLWSRKEGVVAAEKNWLFKSQDWPNWRKIIPAVGGLQFNFPASLSLRYLAQIGLLWNSTDRRTNDVLFLGLREAHPCVAYFPDMPNIMLLGMPMTSPVKMPQSAWAEKFSKPAPKIDADL